MGETIMAQPAGEITRYKPGYTPLILALAKQQTDLYNLYLHPALARNHQVIVEHTV